MTDPDGEYSPKVERRRSPRRRKQTEPIVVSDGSDDGESAPAAPPLPKCELPFQTVHITMDDLDDIKNDKCFNDAVVNAYLVFLGNNHDPGSTIGYTNSFFINKLRRDGCKAASSWQGIDGKRLDVYKKFLIPISTMSHWILVEISFCEGVIRVYDSLGRHGESLVHKIKNFLFWQNIRKKFVTRYPSVPKQDNFHDCGAFVCEFARCIFEDIPLNKETFSQKDAPEIRKRIYSELLPGVSTPLI